MENQEGRSEIVLGVDIHFEVHVRVVIDAAGPCTGHLICRHPG